MALSEEEGRCLVQMWRIIFHGLVTIGKRDQASDESLLPCFYPHFKTWLSQSQFSALLEIAHSLLPGSRDSSRTTSPVTHALPAKNVLVYALGNKVIMSLTCMHLFNSSFSPHLPCSSLFSLLYFQLHSFILFHQHCLLVLTLLLLQPMLFWNHEIYSESLCIVWFSVYLTYLIASPYCPL
jgi:hypothetical protein